jgi:hypothetical protein
LKAEEKLTFTVQRLVCSGWIGRDNNALQAHIDELAEHGIPGPNRTPIFMNFWPHIITTSGAIDVVSGESSGEVEFVIIKEKDQMYISVGSDHTDRGFEKYSIPASKQLYEKVMAPLVWPYDEIKAHWDQIVLRSWITAKGKKNLYQEDPLASILDVEALLASLPKEDTLSTDGLAMFSGTIATKLGLIYGERFDFEMDDPILHRKICHGYQIRILPQYL